MPAMECGDVERFWDHCQQAEPPFPRDLEAALSLHFPVTIVSLPALTAATVDQWLVARGEPRLLRPTRRPLHGCFVAFAGDAFIFVEANDPPDEQRFTLAHEAAHLWLDYLEPREAVIRLLGVDALAVLDGARAPSLVERFNAVLTICPIGVYVQQLDYDSPRTSRSEQRADRFARELLAPREQLRAISPATLESTLIRRFGLPPDQAEIYASQLRAERAPAPSFLDWLRPNHHPTSNSND